MIIIETFSCCAFVAIKTGTMRRMTITISLVHPFQFQDTLMPNALSVHADPSRAFFLTDEVNKGLSTSYRCDLI